MYRSIFSPRLSIIILMMFLLCALPAFSAPGDDKEPSISAAGERGDDPVSSSVSEVKDKDKGPSKKKIIKKGAGAAAAGVAGHKIKSKITDDDKPKGEVRE